MDLIKRKILISRKLIKKFQKIRVKLVWVSTRLIGLRDQVFMKIWISTIEEKSKKIQLNSIIVKLVMIIKVWSLEEVKGKWVKLS